MTGQTTIRLGMHGRLFQIVMLLAPLATLAGCMGVGATAPSASDVTHAVRALVQQQHAAFGASAGKAMTGQVGVHSFGCNPAPDHRGYLCETRITRSPPGHASQTMNRLVRLVKTADGWQATMQ